MNQQNKQQTIRDHVSLGKAMDLFYQEDSVGKGLPLLTPRGTTLKRILIRFIEDEELSRGYLHTQTPIMGKEDLYQTSGHWDHFRENMFMIFLETGRHLVLRPMTCPHQFVLYKRKAHSYRDLPVRYAETATLFRNEASGSLGGLVRIRQFTLSDGHIICRPDQVENELRACLELIDDILKILDFSDYSFRLSKGDFNDKKKFINNNQAWNEAEALLKKLLESGGREYTEETGEAAFYGPKIDVQMKNVWGKEETIFTIQLDIALAERFHMQYTDDKGELKTPVIIHRSSIGCYERTMAMLIEKYQGRLPFWLSPEQLRILPVNDAVLPYAREVGQSLRKKQIRMSIDSDNQTLQKRILRAREDCIPVTLILGQEEANQQSVSIRSLAGEQWKAIKTKDFLDQCMAMDRNKSLNVCFKY